MKNSGIRNDEIDENNNNNNLEDFILVEGDKEINNKISYKDEKINSIEKITKRLNFDSNLNFQFERDVDNDYNEESSNKKPSSSKNLDNIILGENKIDHRKSNISSSENKLSSVPGYNTFSAKSKISDQEVLVKKNSKIKSILNKKNSLNSEENTYFNTGSFISERTSSKNNPYNNKPKISNNNFAKIDEIEESANYTCNINDRLKLYNKNEIKSNNNLNIQKPKDICNNEKRNSIINVSDIANMYIRNSIKNEGKIGFLFEKLLNIKDRCNVITCNLKYNDDNICETNDNFLNLTSKDFRKTNKFNSKEFINKINKLLREDKEILETIKQIAEDHLFLDVFILCSLINKNRNFRNKFSDYKHINSIHSDFDSLNSKNNQISITNPSQLFLESLYFLSGFKSIFLNMIKNETDLRLFYCTKKQEINADKTKNKITKEKAKLCCVIQ